MKKITVLSIALASTLAACATPNLGYNPSAEPTNQPTSSDSASATYSSSSPSYSSAPSNYSSPSSYPSTYAPTPAPTAIVYQTPLPTPYSTPTVETTSSPDGGGENEDAEEVAPNIDTEAFKKALSDILKAEDASNTNSNSSSQNTTQPSNTNSTNNSTQNNSTSTNNTQTSNSSSQNTTQPSNNNNNSSNQDNLSNGKILLQSQGDVFLSSGDGSGLLNLTNSNYEISSPSISPDASKIIFRSYNKKEGLYIMNSDGSNIIPLLNFFGNESKPIWSKDSSKFVFTNVSAMDGSKIYTGAKNNTNLVSVFNRPANFNGLDLSINNKIVFSSDHNSSLDFEIYTMNFDGTELIKLTNNMNGGSIEPQWSPDGTKIAFIGYEEDHKPSLYIINQDGSNLTKLTDNNKLGISRVRWSPDGTKIAFFSDSPSEIYVISLNETKPIKLARGWFPEWSYDGKKIVFSNTLDSSKIYTMNSDGTILKKIIDRSGFVSGWIGN